MYPFDEPISFSHAKRQGKISLTLHHYLNALDPAWDIVRLSQKLPKSVPTLNNELDKAAAYLTSVVWGCTVDHSGLVTTVDLKII